MQARKGSTGSAPFIHNLSARWEWVVNATPRLLYPWERAPVPIVQEAGWAPWPVWTALSPTGARIRTAQHVECSYADYAIPTPCVYCLIYIVVTRIRGLTIRGSNPGWGTIFSSSKRPPWLWSPASLQFNEISGFFPGGKAAGTWIWPLASIRGTGKHEWSYKQWRK